MCRASFTRLQRLPPLDVGMTLLRIEVWDSRGRPLQECCGNFDTPLIPVDHSALAKLHLGIIRDCGRLSAHSVHFFRGGEEVGSWSLDGDYAEATLVPA
jgi:hypothetical protein